VLHGVFDPDPKGGEEQRRGQPLRLYHLEPGVPIPIFRPDGLELAKRLVDRLLPWIAAVPIERRAGLGHRIERRVGDVEVHRPADQQPALAVDVRPPDATVTEAAVPVPGERVLGLVVLIV
jgi:hypothetical protein